MIIILNIILFLICLILIICSLITKKNRFWFPLFSSLVAIIIINLIYLIYSPNMQTLNLLFYVNITSIFFLLFCLFLIVTTILKCIEYYHVQKSKETIDTLSIKQIILYITIPFTIIMLIGSFIIYII